MRVVHCPHDMALSFGAKTFCDAFEPSCQAWAPKGANKVTLVRRDADAGTRVPKYIIFGLFGDCLSTLCWHFKCHSKSCTVEMSCDKCHCNMTSNFADCFLMLVGATVVAKAWIKTCICCKWAIFLCARFGAAATATINSNGIRLKVSLWLVDAANF